MLSFRCGQCGKGLAVGDELAGKPVRCPGCNQVVAAPQPAKVGVPSNAAPGNLLGLTSLGDGARPGDTPSASAVEVTRNDTVVLDEDARKRFESAWRAGTPVTIEKFLTDQSLSHFQATLEELVHIDIEFHWKTWSESAVASSTGRPGAVESYLTRFPQLKRADILQRLVETEFRVRQRLGDKPAAADYRARFPGLKLARLDPQGGPDVTGFLAPAQKPDELGRLGPYRVLEILGRGGMGVVFKAEDTLLQRMVALKAMLPALAGSPTAKDRFFREARAAASLKHPHIVTIHQVGEDRGAPFLAMEFLEGESLDDRLKREKKLPIADVLRIGIEVAEGLACAHDKGLIHRDIKPANIWLEIRGQESGVRGQESGKLPADRLAVSRTPCLAKILDFGLARALAEQTQLTQSGAIIGTPAYMAPEQAGGKQVDHRADLFSLGCVLYRACTGEMPFKGNDTMSILSAIALQTPTPPAALNPEVTQGLSEVIMALLAKEASDRPATARDVAQILREFTTDGNDTALLRFDTGKAKPVARQQVNLATRLKTLQALAGRKKKPLLAGVAALIAILLAFGLVSRERERPETNGDDPLVVNPADKLGTQASAYDELRRADINPYELRIAGGGDAAKAAPELVAIFGDSRLMHGNAGNGFAMDANLVFNPKGDRIASVEQDLMIRVWDATTGEQLHVLDVGRRWPRFLPYFFRTMSLRPQFSADGREVFFLAEEKIRAWNLATNGVRDLPVRLHDAVAMRLSTDAQTAAIQSADARIQVWDVSSGKAQFTLQGDPFADGINFAHEDTCFTLSGDGKRLAFVKNKVVKVWNVPENKEEQTVPIPSRGFLAFSVDGKLLGIPANGAPTRKDGITVWDLAARKPMFNSGLLGWHAASVAFSADGRYVAGAARVWDLASKKVLFQLKNQQPRSWDHSPLIMTFSPDSKRIASVDNRGRVRIWNLSGEELLQAKENDWSVITGAVTASQIVTYEDNGQFHFWDVRTRRARMLPTKLGGTRLLQPSPDGNRLAACQIRGNVTVLDAATGATLHTVVPPDGFATDGTSCANVDCTFVATGGGKGVMLWNLEKAQQRQLPIPLGGYRFVFTRNGKLLANLHERLSVWDLESDKLVTDFRLRQVMEAYSPAKASPDSTMLGFHVPGTVYLVDLSNGEIVKEFPKQDLLAFSPDGKKLATTGGSTLNIWDPRSGTRERQIDLGLGQVPAFLDYAPDGRHIVVGNSNGTVFVLRLTK